jgi:hypothetical protein
MTAAILLIAGCSGAGSAASRSPPLPGLAGAWRARLQFSEGAFAAMKDLEFMYAFNAGGTMTESSNYDGAPPVPPAYGVWREVAPREFEAKYVFYVTRPPKRLDEITGGGGWLPDGRGEFTERIRLAADGQSFESTIAYQAFDAAGAPAPGGGHATGRGVRIGF